MDASTNCLSCHSNVQVLRSAFSYSQDRIQDLRYRQRALYGGGACKTDSISTSAVMALPTVDVRPAASYSGRALGSSPSMGQRKVQYVPTRAHSPSAEAASSPRCTESDVLRATRTQGVGGDARYFCQATELLNYTKPLSWWDARQYIESYRSGNRTLPEIAPLAFFFILLYYYGTLAFQRQLGAPGALAVQ